MRLILKDYKFYFSMVWNDFFLMLLPRDSTIVNKSILYLLNRNCKSIGILLTITTGLNISTLYTVVDAIY